MCKKSLHPAQVEPDACVEQAAQWARWLTQAEARGPGDLENAWRRLESRYGIPARAMWALRYRRPKEIVASLYFRLRAAYEAERERQIRRLQRDLDIEQIVSGEGMD